MKTKNEMQLHMVPIDIPAGYHPFMYLFSAELYKAQGAGMEGVVGVLVALGSALAHTSSMPDEYRKAMTVEGLSELASTIVNDVLATCSAGKGVVSTTELDQAHEIAARGDAPATFRDLIDQVAKRTRGPKHNGNDNPVN